MLEFFDASIMEEQKILASRDAHPQKFFAADCRWNSRAGTLRMIETKAIVSVEESEAAVIADYKVPF